VARSYLEERPMGTDLELEGFEVLSRQECGALLSRGCVGRVGFVVGGRPQVLPVNYAADDAGVVVFRTSANSILMAVAMQAVVFEVDGLDEAHRTGWSVCVHGSAREITERDDPIAERLRTLAVIPWAPGHRQRWFAITPAEITGRRLPVQGMAEGLGGWYPGIPS
jgi:nitroimidazol reductase NimA-like FMN-containing flavoprotein (pyridoxamine 5'-phosphate oxidase superfamily)